jgi:hypothetical protein
MKTVWRSTLLSMALILTACLLAGAAAGAPPQKRCFNADGEEIPCPNSNYLQTQYAQRQTARAIGPTAPLVVASVTPAPTASPTVTPTSTEAPTESPAPSLTQAQEAAPSVTSAPQAASPQAPTTLKLLPIFAMLGCAGLLAVVLIFLLFRWFSSRRS